MVKSIEEILGKIERERMIPGTRPEEDKTVLYVSINNGDDPGKVYREVIMKVNPPFMKDGGVMLDGCILSIPDGMRFYPLVLNGDIEGWQRQIKQGAQELGLITAHIDSDTFVLSDSRSYPLASCSVEFD